MRYNILSVVTNWLAAHPDNTYRFYVQNGFRYIQFIPSLDGLGNREQTGDFALKVKKFGDFLCRIFDLWYGDFIKDDYYSIRAFDNYIQMLYGYPPENCAMNGTCSAYALVEADGNVYPCDFYAVDKYLLGNVKESSFEKMLTGEKAIEFLSPSHYIDPVCREREHGFICRGGCRRDREPVIGGKPCLNRYCEAYKAFFAYTLPRMESIAASFKRREDIFAK